MLPGVPFLYFISLIFTLALGLFSNDYKTAASTQDFTSSDFQWDRESFNSGTNVLNFALIGSIWITCPALNAYGIREVATQGNLGYVWEEEEKMESYYKIQQMSTT